eukprot:CAMPEP_0173408004 /NCGR_PEP_ID=MMETSP1356-20130122/68568_1 /TAXON_ID=77927 ORGANISM="Hemiselmis virescens, Strain PCC157" /NCGR_SAMPLE_ID=MMETSP1356 /ASSEMBLY_ACC=CAM_ASM_000847 /LENGTH=126 /DNA_ID=CAMNT_0014369239 /DNA_START=149 /DNA_END=529 /DNA_ORIENTATION=+
MPFVQAARRYPGATGCPPSSGSCRLLYYSEWEHHEDDAARGFKSALPCPPDSGAERPPDALEGVRNGKRRLLSLLRRLRIAQQVEKHPLRIQRRSESSCYERWQQAQSLQELQTRPYLSLPMAAMP